MKVSLEWLLQQSGLKGLRCITGESLLRKKKFQGISVLDNPNATRWVKEGELVITSGYILEEQKEKKRHDHQRTDRGRLYRIGN
ncbi:hypothetical protein DWV67_08475 [Dorea formicigenerans]|uniref:Purine catabolism PurC-like domain-containing protein n=1 Tax=Dorea formicigenerans TaxID=39486 RepID=A0A395XQQ2_9FIRM|nr:hypothetical protein DWV67_08475 [Dorea formicigenerans]